MESEKLTHVSILNTKYSQVNQSKEREFAEMLEELFSELNQEKQELNKKDH
jgi:hypothetical protein